MPKIQSIKCVKCDCALLGPVDPGPADRFSCPTCGEGDTRDNVLKEAGEYAKDQAAIEIQKKAQEVARSSRFITYSSHYQPRQDYRFKVDVDFGSSP